MGRLLPLLVCLCLGCEGPAPGDLCAADVECGETLACLDGRCALALEDPGGTRAPPGGPVRVIAVGMHPTLTDVESQAAWRAYVRDLFANEVVPLLATDRENLVVLPENTALTTAFIGARGAPGRLESSATGALGAVLVGYRDAVAFYVGRAESELSAGRLVTLSVTDTVWRALAVFEELAREHGVWLAVTTDVARAERTTDPALIGALVDDDEADRSFAFVAIGDEVYNQTIVYGPDGAMVHAFDKEYLIPAEEDDLDLSYGPPGTLRAVDLPFGRVSSVISKDAWMPDVLGRLALDGAALMLQPEAFGGWAAHGDDAAWGPDVVKEGGWMHVMRYPEFRVNVLPCMSSNLFELVFDCQTSILADRRHFDGTGAWVGQDPDVGFAVVAPWAAEDDGIGTLDERRARLQSVADALAPGSGDPMEDAYPAFARHFDADLSAPWPGGALAAGEVEVAPAAEGEQRRPTIATTDDGVVIFWEDDRAGQTRIYGALVDGAGTLGEARVRVVTDAEVRAIRAAASGRSVHLVWQEARGMRWIVRHASSTDGGRSFGEAVDVDPADAGSQYVPDVAVDPSSGIAHLVWVDTREVAATLRVARHDGAAVSTSEAIEAAAPPLYDPRQNRWAPSIAVSGGERLVVWADFREFVWGIWGARAPSGGGFAAPVRLDDGQDAVESLSSDPRVGFGPDGIVVAWTDLRVRHPDYDVRVRGGWGSAAPASVSVASTDGDARPQWEPALALTGETLHVAWQDFRERSNQIRLTSGPAGATSFEADVVVGASDEVDRFHPALARLEERAAIVYESTASGARRVVLWLAD